MALTPHAALLQQEGGPSRDWRHWEEVGVSCEKKPVLCRAGGLRSAAAQFLLVTAAPVQSGGRKPPPEQIPSMQTPQDFVPGTQVTPQMHSPDTRTALASLTRWGRQSPFLQPEDEEEQAANNWDTVSPWASRQLLTTGILTCDLASHGSLPTSL